MQINEHKLKHSYMNDGVLPCNYPIATIFGCYCTLACSNANEFDNIDHFRRLDSLNNIIISRAASRWIRIANIFELLRPNSDRLRITFANEFAKRPFLEKFYAIKSNNAKKMRNIVNQFENDSQFFGKYRKIANQLEK